MEFCAKAAQKDAELGLVFAADAVVVPGTLNMYPGTLAADPRNLKPDDVPDIPFAMTILGGEIVWSS